MRKTINKLRFVLIYGFHNENPDLIAKREAAIQYLGTKWICHPDNRVRRN